MKTAIEILEQLLIDKHNAKNYIGNKMNVSVDTILEAMEEFARQFKHDEVFPKKICDKCRGEIKRKHIYSCPTNGKIYCEKCINPN